MNCPKTQQNNTHKHTQEKKPAVITIVHKQVLETDASFVAEGRIYDYEEKRISWFSTVSIASLTEHFL